ncbi:MULTISPECIES: PhzF family phenazine biosynthesis protein [unclassified Streptomyces]|uniref:PhzF family phenazine biosynthesis protein n=1 Tax=unclassified Streptomyces TaxID=2593676 RepID=UPI002E1176EB|nr:PhzF family phenazine biosynthesis protein [Streptomyces sp. NBC_01197]WSS53025.1 PhzF family phenazine biosynthesis protein [Streptomyces sp. NBC_01180]
MTDLEIVQVFVRPDGTGGSPLGVVCEGTAVPGTAERQETARRLGFSETVFVDDPARGEVDIYTPSVRLPFAGYPLIGTAWLLRRHGLSADVLRTVAGDVTTWTEGEFTWIRGRAEWVSGKRTQEYPSVAAVDALPAPPAGDGWLYAWAWADEAAGTIRARGFPRRGDAIAEDEATGAAAMVLAGELGRDLRISQGRGSEILARLSDGGWIEIGGRVAATEVRPLHR